jgi:hypothetical protein
VSTLEQGRRHGVGNADARPAMGRMARDRAALGPGRRRLGQAGDEEDSDGLGAERQRSGVAVPRVGQHRHGRRCGEQTRRRRRIKKWFQSEGTVRRVGREDLAHWYEILKNVSYPRYVRQLMIYSSVLVLRNISQLYSSSLRKIKAPRIVKYFSCGVRVVVLLLSIGVC